MTTYQKEDNFINQRKKKILTLLKQGKTDEAKGHLWMLGFNSKNLDIDVKHDIVRFMQDIKYEMMNGNTAGMYHTLPSSLNLDNYAGVRSI